MKRLTNLTLLFLSFSFSIYGQFGIVGGFGLGSYNMNSLKEFNATNQIINNAGRTITLNQLENFPMFRTFSLGGFYDISVDSRLTGSLIYLTTGSRLYAEDYSGKISFDIITSSVALNSTLSHTVFKFPWCSTGLFIGPQILFGKTKFKSRLKINNSDIESSDFMGNSINLGLSAGLFIRKRIKQFEFSIESGFYYDLAKGSLKTNVEGNEYKIQNQKTGEDLKNNWSGIRLSLGLSYFIK